MSSVQVETRVVTSLSTGARAAIVGAGLLLLAAVFFLVAPIEQPTQAGPPFRCGTAVAPLEGDFAGSICAGQVRRQQLLAATLGAAAVVLAGGGVWAFGVRRRTQRHVLHEDELFPAHAAQDPPAT